MDGERAVLLLVSFMMKMRKKFLYINIHWMSREGKGFLLLAELSDAESCWRQKVLLIFMSLDFKAQKFFSTLRGERFRATFRNLECVSKGLIRLEITARKAFTLSESLSFFVDVFAREKSSLEKRFELVIMKANWHNPLWDLINLLTDQLTKVTLKELWNLTISTYFS